MKKTATGLKKIRLSRETLRQLNVEQLAVAQGGATLGRTCDSSSQCGGTTGCTVTACGHC